MESRSWWAFIVELMSLKIRIYQLLRRLVLDHAAILGDTLEKLPMKKVELSRK